MASGTLALTALSLNACSLRANPARRIATVKPNDDFTAILASAQAAGGHTTLLMADGIYDIDRTLKVETAGIEIRSASGQREKVIIRGDRMAGSARIGNLFRVSAPDFTLRSVTLQRCGNHLVQIAGESGAHRARLIDCVFQDSFEQLVKVSGHRPGTGHTLCEDGLVEGCLFEYTAGIGPQYYIGGLDGHNCSRWTVRGNTFRGIASPSRHIAEHAIHFWGIQDIRVENNLIIDCDRGIGFGMGPDRSVKRGTIRNSMIFHSANAHPFADAGIVLESSSRIDVLNNTVFQEHAYPRAIEFRFSGTRDGRIINNLTNRAIAARDGGTAVVSNNYTRAESSMFVDAARADLHLKAAIAGVTDAGIAMDEVKADFDGRARPRGAGHDIGAHEF
jgi:hypothetical protein